MTQVSYPDGTTSQTVYDKLDPVLLKDRLGRWTQRSFDTLDQLAYVIDPLGRQTKYIWCNCGSLSSLTDPNGNTTTWQHDIEGELHKRPTQMEVPGPTNTILSEEFPITRTPSVKKSLTAIIWMIA